MNKLFWIKVIAISGLLSVVIGAFATHVLEALITPERMQTLQTAAQYQIYYSLALFCVICLDDKILALRWKKYAAGFFLSGIVLFSGSLYLLVVTNISQLGIITPLGGLSFIAGWIMLLVAAIREK